MSSLGLSDFALRRVPKNHAHLPKISTGSSSILPSSSRMYCELAFRVPSMFRDLRRLASRHVPFSGTYFVVVAVKNLHRIYNTSRVSFSHASRVITW